MAKITINIPITVEAELDKYGRIQINSAQLPNNAAIEQEILKLSTVKQVLIRTKLRLNTDPLGVGDRVKCIGFKENGPTGTIKALGTELGPDYASVCFDGRDAYFHHQILKEDLIRV